MPEVRITIGGRQFEVACQEGEEPFLIAAAKMLDSEAASLSSQIGRVPEARMLLMAGLLLADKTAALEDKLRETEAKLALAASQPAVQPERIEVPTIPREVVENFADLTAQAEALAEDLATR